MHRAPRRQPPRLGLRLPRQLRARHRHASLRAARAQVQAAGRAASGAPRRTTPGRRAAAGAGVVAQRSVLPHGTLRAVPPRLHRWLLWRRARAKDQAPQLRRLCQRHVLRVHAPPHAPALVARLPDRGVLLPAAVAAQAGEGGAEPRATALHASHLACGARGAAVLLVGVAAVAGGAPLADVEALAARQPRLAHLLPPPRHEAERLRERGAGVRNTSSTATAAAAAALRAGPLLRTLQSPCAEHCPPKLTTFPIPLDGLACDGSRQPQKQRELGPTRERSSPVAELRYEP